MKNAGWLFYRDYYKSLSDSQLQYFVAHGKLSNKKDDPFFTAESDALLDFRWDNSHTSLFPTGNQQFELKTTYPGLVIGSGYSHQTGSMGEFKLGFYFDHSTGLPVIPGSSVKGLLRSAFPNREERPAIQKMKVKLISELLGKTRPELLAFPITLLEDLIFKGKQPGTAEYLPMHQHDVFLDACITSTENNGGLIFGEDYITPHPNPLKNPIPVRFLKILPDVTFRFHFELKPTIIGGAEISALEKRELFKEILLLFGIGAKTNVGYGQFA